MKVTFEFQTSFCLLSRHRPFRTEIVDSGHPVSAIAHSVGGDKFLVCTGSPQPRLYDKDGAHIITFVRGDMYIRDLANTKVKKLTKQAAADRERETTEIQCLF